MTVELRIHKSMSCDVNTYEANATQAAIVALCEAGAPNTASLKTEWVGSYEFPRVLITMSWSEVVNVEVPVVPS